MKHATRSWSSNRAKFQITNTTKPQAILLLLAVSLHAPLFSAESGQDKRVTVKAPPDKIATMIMEKPIYPIGIHAIAFGPDGGTIAGGDGTGHLRLWETKSGKLIHDLRAHSNWVFAITWTRDGSRIITGGGDNLIHWFDGANPTTPQRTIQIHSNDVHAVAVSRDARTMFSAGDDRQIVIWDSRPGRIRERFTAHERQIPALVLSPNQRLLASGSRDHSIKLWNARNGELRDTLIGHTGDVMALSFSPDGSLLASAGWDNTVRLWDVDEGKAVRILPVQHGRVSGVAFSPDGKHLVSSSGSRLRLFEGGTGKEIWSAEFNAEIQGPAAEKTGEDLSMVAFSPDGQQIAAGSTTGSIYLVSSESGKVIRTLNAQDSERSNQGASLP